MGRFQQAKEEIKTRSKDMKKAIKVYTIELLAFSAVFITLGVLELCGIIGNNLSWRTVFTYITMVGVVLYLALTIWSIADPKRRAKTDLLDRLMLAPGPIAVLVLDIITLVKGVDNETVQILHKYIIGCVFIYFGLCYIFQAIYHYFFPLKALLDIGAQEEEEEVAGDVVADIPEESLEEKSEEKVEEKEVKETPTEEEGQQ